MARVWAIGLCAMVLACAGSSGSDPGTGGAATEVGGSAGSGAPEGGSSTAGTATGGSLTGGSSTGGAATGGSSTGSASDGGAPSMDPECFDEANPEPPPPGAFEQALDEATGHDGLCGVALEACEPAYCYVALPFGSAWLVVHPDGDAYCEIWLGGETENPGYDGQPTQYCRFLRNACRSVAVSAGSGGPAHIESEACTPSPG